jgi:hypothetical protein
MGGLAIMDAPQGVWLILLLVSYADWRVDNAAAIVRVFVNDEYWNN